MEDNGLWKIQQSFSMNNGNAITLFVIYTVVDDSGLIAFLFNVFNVVVLSTKRELREKYTLLIALECAESINGIAYVTTAMGRLLMFIEGILQTPISMQDCFLTKPWPILLITGTQLPALIVIAISIERISAVYFPAKYNKYWTNGMKLQLIGAIIFLQLISLLIGGFSASSRIINTSSHCAALSSISIAYAMVHFTFTVVAFVISCVTLAIVYVHKMSILRNRSSNFPLYLSTTFLCVIVMSFPAAISLGIHLNLIQTTDLVFGICIVMPGLISIATTIFNLLFHQEYKKRVYKLLFCNNSSPTRETTTTVLPSSDHSKYIGKDRSLFTISSSQQTPINIIAKTLRKK